MLNDPTDQLMISKFLQIGHLILSWQFSKGRASRLALLRADSTVEIPFRPPRSWAQLVTSNDFVALWFSTHGAVRRIPELANLSSNCIQQVCSLKVLTRANPFSCSFLFSRMFSLVPKKKRNGLYLLLRQFSEHFQIGFRLRKVFRHDDDVDRFLK